MWMSLFSKWRSIGHPKLSVRKNWLVFSYCDFAVCLNVVGWLLFLQVWVSLTPRKLTIAFFTPFVTVLTSSLTGIAGKRGQHLLKHFFPDFLLDPFSGVCPTALVLSPSFDLESPSGLACSGFKLQSTFATQVITLNYSVILFHRHSITVSLETYPLCSSKASLSRTLCNATSIAI